MVNELKKAIGRGNVVVVAGTGVSITASGNQKVDGFEVAGWSGLLRHGLWYGREKERIIDEKTEKILKLQIESGDTDFLIQAAEMISKKFQEKSSGTYHRWLKDSIGQLQPIAPDVIDALHSLGGILSTLNYDQLLETRLGFSSITWQQHDKVDDLLRGNRTNAVLHLHGFFDEPESVILGSKSYERIKDDKHSETVLRSFTLDRTLIFVGCKATIQDPNFKHLLEWGHTALEQSTYRHFIICHESELAAIDQDLKQYKTAWLTPVSYGDSYDQLVPFLKSLTSNDGKVTTQITPQQKTLARFDQPCYIKAFKERYARVKLESVETTGSSYRELTLKQIFIPQSVRPCQQYLPQVLELPKELLEKLKAKGEVDPDTLATDEMEERRKTYFGQSPRSVQDLMVGRDYERLVILGDPGSGKSSLLQHWALTWCDLSPVDRKDAHTPLLIELRAYALAYDQNRCNNFEQFLSEGMGVPCTIDMKTLTDGLAAGLFCVCFDALDEVFDPKLRERMVNEMLRFANTYPAVRIVLTSRVFGYKGDAFRDAGFQHVMLQDLDDSQISVFLDRWHQNTFDASEADLRKTKLSQISLAIQQSPAIRQLAGNPLLLTMMTILNRYRDLPRDRVELYQECTKLLLQQWKVDEAFRAVPDLTQDAGAIGLREKEAILCALARTIQENSGGNAGGTALVNLIPVQRLEKVIEDEVRGIVRGSPRGVARALIEQLRLRNFILCFVGGENYAFIHRTFLEYFCARDLQQRFETSQTVSIDDLKDKIVGRYYLDDTWEEVLCLLAGMIAPKFVKELIEFLLGKKDPEQNCRHIFMAARFVGEVRRKGEIGEVNKNIKILIVNIILRDLRFYGNQIFDIIKAIDINKTAIEVLSRGWKEDPETLVWLKKSAQINEKGAVRQAAMRELSRGWKEDPETLTILKKRAQTDESGAVRRAAIQELSRGWKEDPETLVLIKKWVQTDENEDVRRAAIQELSHGWKEDPETLTILKKRAQTDDSGAVRRGAIQELSRGWKDDPETLTILKTRAQTDEAGYVRQAAIQGLSRGRKEDPETLTILKTQAQTDAEGYVRQAAIQELSRGWKEDPETLLILKTQAQTDEEGNVRKTAIEELSRGWKEDPNTIELLKKWAQTDKNLAVRQAAIKELSRGWKDDPKTLVLLKKWAQTDENLAVRQAAIQELSRGWKEDPDTLELLKKWAQTDKNLAVRQAAIQELSRGWKDDLETLTILKMRAQTDKTGYVRQVAMRELSRGWKEDPETLVLIKKLVQIDESGAVRRAAIQELSRGWKEDPETLTILKTRAQTDEAGYVRQAAIQGLSRGWKEDPETLRILKTQAQTDEAGYVRQTAIQELSRGWKNDLEVQNFLESLSPISE